MRLRAPARMQSDMLASSQNFNPETLTKRSFALKCAADRGIGDRKGEAEWPNSSQIWVWCWSSGLVLAVLIALFPDSGYRPPTGDLLNGVLQWLHVFFGITWIGLLYYFNFVQTPTMPTIPAELKPGVSKYIAPKALCFISAGARRSRC